MKELGLKGELLAKNYLISLGYNFIESNFYNSFGYRKGEIDLIFKEGGQIVFVEVKARLESRLGEVNPELAVNRSKLKKLEKIIQFYLKKRHLLDSSWRLDVIAIVFNLSTRRANLKHFKNI